jgi:hypothetical protein
MVYINLQTLDAVNSKRKDGSDGRNTTEELTESLHEHMNCECFIEYYSLTLIYPAFSVNDNALNHGLDTGVMILPQPIRYVADESSEWAGLDYKLKVHKLSSVSMNLT